MSTVKETILLASDHNGNESRAKLFQKLKSWGYNPVDLGPEFENSSMGTVKVDYTRYASQLANAISKNQNLKGILICGTGVGMSIAANRYKGVRASLVTDVNTAIKTREHNDSNVLVMGAWNTSFSLQEEILVNWLKTDFGKGRHEKRVVDLNDHKPEDVVLVPGVFEIIQPGHLQLFEFARKFGRVVVALNSDKSATGVKGRTPAINQDVRASVLNALENVDEVIIMDDPTPVNLLVETDADYIVKGGIAGDEDKVRKFDGVPEGCEVKIFPYDHKYSTQKMREIIGK